jgi:hypothetical protein
MLVLCYVSAMLQVVMMMPLRMLTVINLNLLMNQKRRVVQSLCKVIKLLILLKKILKAILKSKLRLKLKR